MLSWYTWFYETTWKVKLNFRVLRINNIFLWVLPILHVLHKQIEPLKNTGLPKRSSLLIVCLKSREPLYGFNNSKLFPNDFKWRPWSFKFNLAYAWNSKFWWLLRLKTLKQLVLCSYIWGLFIHPHIFFHLAMQSDCCFCKIWKSKMPWSNQWNPFFSFLKRKIANSFLLL